MLITPYKRDFGVIPPKGSGYTANQEFILQVLALTFSSISLLSATLSLYWFVFMRRTFRHDLIMFVIQSDLLKALWLMVYAIRALVPGAIDSSSTFCQVDGFFTSLAMKASDFAILMIALHSVLYIFNPPTTPGEGGLYPYRHIAFVFWIVFPAFMASLAFLNPAGAYYASGTSCVLPVRPFWYRLALDWVPRYVIFITILSLDAAIYVYVRYKFGDFGGDPGASNQSISRQDSDQRREWSGHDTKPPKNYGPPKTPQLVYNGLIPETRKPSAASEVDHRRSISTHRPFAVANRCSTERTRSILRGAKKILRSTTRALIPSGSNMSSPQLGTKFTDNVSLSEIEPSPTAILTPKSNLPPSEHSSWTTIIARFSSRSPSRISVHSFLRLRLHHRGYPSGASTPAPGLELVNSAGYNLTQIAMLETRDKIRYQLRFLFIYPLAYMAMWILPFIAHALQYNDEYVNNPPFVLSAFVSVIITSQCAVDCWIFNLREKPWRSFVRENSIIEKGFIFLKDLTIGRRRSSQMTGPGKSRNEMAAEARVAYRRRDEERTVRLSEISTAERTTKGERSWWDDLEDHIVPMAPRVEMTLTTFDGPSAAKSKAIPDQEYSSGEWKRKFSRTRAE